MPDFSSTHSTTARSGGLWYRPTTSTTFSTNNGSADSLNVPVKCGLRSNLRQIRPIVDFDSPLRRAIEARDQCVASCGISSSVAVMTSSTRSSRIDGGRPGRGSSCRPSRRRRRTGPASGPRSTHPPPDRRRPACSSRPPRRPARSSPAAPATGRSSPAAPTGSAAPAPPRPGPAQPSAGRPAHHLPARPALRPRTCAATWTPTSATPAPRRPAHATPSAHARMIRARSARQRPGSPARRTSSARSSSDSTIWQQQDPNST